MDLRHLKTFVTVVDENSFSRAAQKLILSQPTVSTHIRLLEEEAQCRLILRTTKSIRVTPRGQELYTCARRMLSLQEGLKSQWSRESERTLHLGSSTIPSAYILPEILPSFKKIHPEISFTIHQSDSQGVITGILEDSFELGLIGMPVDDPALECVPFYTDAMVLITPATDHYRTYLEKGLTLQDIKSEPLLMREQGSGSRKAMENYLAARGLDPEELTITARLNDQESIKNLVAAGLGISIISEKAIISDPLPSRFLTFPLPGESIRRRLYLISRTDYILREQTRNFKTHILGYYE